MFNAIKNCIKNWCRICRNKKANTIVLKVHKISIEYNLSWHAAVKKRLGEVGIGMESNITDIVLHGESNITDIHTAAFEKLKDIFHQESFLSINNQESKLRTYGKLKTSIGMEKYLEVMINMEEREAI